MIDNRSYIYELAYDGQGEDGTPFLAGLLDATDAEASRTTAETSQDADANVTEAGRPPDRAEPDRGRAAGLPVKPADSGDNPNAATTSPERSRTRADQQSPSHIPAEATR